MIIKLANNVESNPQIYDFKDLIPNKFYKVVSEDYNGAIVLALQPDYKTESLSRLVLLVVHHNSDGYRMIIGKPYAENMQFQLHEMDAKVTLVIDNTKG